MRDQLPAYMEQPVDRVATAYMEQMTDHTSVKLITDSLKCDETEISAWWRGKLSLEKCE